MALRIAGIAGKPDHGGNSGKVAEQSRQEKPGQATASG